jgi:hypothetical protein
MYWLAALCGTVGVTILATLIALAILNPEVPCFCS